MNGVTRIVWLALISSLLIQISADAIAQESEVRAWKSAQGNYTIRAVLQEDLGDKVVLRRQDGSQVTVAKAKLSQTDQDYLSNLSSNPSSSAASSADPSGKKPFDPRMPRRSSSKKGMDYSEVKILTVQGVTDWNMPVVARPDIELREAETIPLPEVKSKRGGIVSDALGTQIYWLSHSSEYCYLDLRKNGNPYVATPRNKGLIPLALSPNADYVVASTEMGLKAEELLLMKAKGASVQFSWIFSASKVFHQLTFARFISHSKLVTVDFAGVISLWDLQAKKLIWQIQSAPGCRPGITFDDRYLVSCTGDHLFVIDLESDQIKCAQPNKLGLAHDFSFSPDGERLLVLGPGEVSVVDWETGARIESWNYPMARTLQVAGWLNDHQVWLGRSTRLAKSNAGYFDVMDLNVKNEIWSFSAWGPTEFDAQGRLWVLENERGQGVKLEGYKIPASKLDSAVDQVEATTEVYLQPGSRVRLDVSAIVHDATPELHKQIVDQMKEAARRSFEGTRSSRNPNRGRSTRYGSSSSGYSKIPTYDASQRATEIIQAKVEEAGFVIDPGASYTLRVELGPLGQVTNFNPPNSRTSMTKPSPFGLRLQYWLTNSRGERLVKTVVDSWSNFDGNDFKASSIDREEVEKVQKINFPQYFVSSIKRKKISRLGGGEIIDSPTNR